MRYHKLARDIGYLPEVIAKAIQYEDRLKKANKPSSRMLPINMFVTGLFLACKEHDIPTNKTKLRSQFGIGMRSIQQNLKKLKNLGVDTHEL